MLCTVLVLVLTPCNGPGQCGGGGGRGGASGRAVSWARQNNNSGSALSSACLVRVWWIVQEALVVMLLFGCYPYIHTRHSIRVGATGAILLSVLVSARDHDAVTILLAPDSSCRLVPPNLRQEDIGDSALYIGQLVLQ